MLLRYFLGGGKCVSNVALRGDMGWNSCFVKTKMEVFRLWIKLRHVEDDRILKCIPKWSKRNGRGWEARVIKLSNGLNVSGLIQDSHLPIRTALNALKETLSNKDSENWNKQLNDSEKLQTNMKRIRILQIQKSIVVYLYLGTTAAFFANCVHVAYRSW